MSERKTVLVTGGSRGIGAAIVHRFAAEGWRVVLTYRADAAAAEAVVADTNAWALQCDVGDEASILELFETLDAHDVVLGALVNNAAVTGPKRRVEEVTWATLDEVCRVDFMGVVACCREAVMRMSTRTGGLGGAIVNISSTATRRGAPEQWADYAAIKGAIDVFTNGLAREVGEEGVRVNAVAPGYVLTDMAVAGGIADRFDDMKWEVPMGRIGQVDDIAAAVHWLCTEDAGYITGTVLPVAGGR